MRHTAKKETLLFEEETIIPVNHSLNETIKILALYALLL